MSIENLVVGWTAEDGAVTRVGTVTLLGGAQIQSFTYDRDWLATGFPIGEGLPLAPEPQAPADGTSTFGVLDDAGPDAWGRRVISRSRPLAEISTSLGMLAAVADESRQGALRFAADPDAGWTTTGDVAPLEELAALEADVAALVRGEADAAAVRRIYLGSSSQGGARPKTALRRPDGSLVMAKFPWEQDAYDVEACEAVALAVAEDAGLEVPPFRLERLDAGRSVLLVDRFDRTTRGRLGYQSMRTAAALGPFEPMTYRLAADTARFVAGSSAVHGVVGAAALAICVHNIDDHARNLGFVRRAGAWRLAPLFDLVPFPKEQTGTPIDGASPDRSLEQLLDTDWGVARSDVIRLVTRVAQTARGAWERAPRATGLDPEIAALMGRVVEDACDFGTVLDGTEPRFES